jgi:hypothetical protein
VATLLLAGAFALMVGLTMRSARAYVCALALDSAGVAALLVWGATGFSSGQSWLVMLLAVFPLSLVLLTWVLRAAYAAPAASLPQTAP